MPERRDDGSPPLPYGLGTRRESPPLRSLSKLGDAGSRLSSRVPGSAVEWCMSTGLLLALVLAYGVLDTATTVAVFEWLPATTSERSPLVLPFYYAATRAEYPVATYALLGLLKCEVAAVSGVLLRRRVDRWRTVVVALLGLSLYVSATNAMLLLGWV